MVNAIFFTMFTLANVFNICELDSDDDELKPLQPKERETPNMAHSVEVLKVREKSPSELVRDLYVSGVGR